MQLISTSHLSVCNIDNIMGQIDFFFLPFKCSRNFPPPLSQLGWLLILFLPLIVLCVGGAHSGDSCNQILRWFQSYGDWGYNHEELW